ncbi:MAG: ABC transporter ATP-binding protein [Polyangiaceae bacterium]|jgi:ATP-binding cassette subfamily B protein
MRDGTVVIRALRVLAPSWLALAASFFLVLSTLSALSGPWILRYAVDHGLQGGKPNLGVIRACSAAYLAVALAAVAFGRTHTRLTGIVGERLVRDLRNAVFSHLLGMSVRYFDRHPRGRLIARMTSDIDALQDLVQLGLVQFVQSVLTLLLLVVLLSLLSWRLWLVCLVPAPFLVWATRRFQRRSRRAYLDVRERVGATTSTLVENLTGAKVVQAFGQERARIERFVGENRRQLDANIDAIVVQARYLPVVELTTVLSTAIALGAGGWLVWHGQATLGSVTAFALYLLMAFEPVQALSFLFNTVESASAALQKIFEVLDEPVDLRGGDAALAARQPLAVRDVSFSYAPEGRPVLSEVSLELLHGERLALVGPTGSGKSTLAKIIARLFDPSSGVVTYGGVDLREASLASLRERIAIVSQEEHLFQGTVADNVRAARPTATDEEVAEALRSIGAYERFAAMPGGIRAAVGERGAFLSAGERQLITLARAALLSADVLILDEPTSSLDPGTERQVNRALESVMRDRTVIFIAHRLSTMKQVDRIAVIAGGALAEIGSHDELMARRGAYRTLYDEWLRASELEAEVA